MTPSLDLVCRRLPPEQLLSLADVAALLDVTPRRVRQLVADGEWSVVYVGPRRRYIRVAVLYEWLHGEFQLTD